MSKGAGPFHFPLRWMRGGEQLEVTMAAGWRRMAFVGQWQVTTPLNNYYAYTPPPPTSLPRVLWRIITVSFFTSFLPSFLSFFLSSVRVSIFFRWLPSCIQSRNRESLRRDRRGSAPTNEGIGDAELFVRMRRIKRPIRTRRGVCLSTVNSDLTPS